MYASKDYEDADLLKSVSLHSLSNSIYVAGSSLLCVQVLQNVSRLAGFDFDADGALSKGKVIPSLIILFSKTLNLVTKTDPACAMNMLKKMTEHRVCT